MGVGGDLLACLIINADRDFCRRLSRAGGKPILVSGIKIHCDQCVVVWLNGPAPMAVPGFESIICKCSGKIERGLTRLDLGICLGAHRKAGDQHHDRQKNRREAFHFAMVMFSIFSITFPTASFTFRTCSTLGALSAGKETSFSMPPSCSLTSLTSGSLRSSGEISFTFDCINLTSAGWRSTFALRSS